MNINIVNQDDFSEKVKLVVEGLLAHEVTKDDALKLLSAIVLVPEPRSRVVVQEALELQKRRDAQRDDPGIPLDDLRAQGVRLTDADPDARPLKRLSPDLEFKVFFEKEYNPIFSEDRAERWIKMAGIDDNQALYDPEKEHKPAVREWVTSEQRAEFERISALRWGPKVPDSAYDVLAEFAETLTFGGDRNFKGD